MQILFLKTRKKTENIFVFSDNPVLFAGLQMDCNWGKIRKTVLEVAMENLRFGIVGMGVQGKLYAALLTGQAIPGGDTLPLPKGCVLTAVSSRSAETAALAKALGVHYFSDWKQLVESDICDAIIITVPHYLHHEVAMYAFTQGKHVLCEKPADIRASDVEKMLAAQGDLALGMIFNHRTKPVFRKLKEIIATGELGKLRRSNWIINSWWRPDSYYQSNVWRGTWSGEGGGVVVNQLPHQLDLWLGLCGMPEQVYCLAKEGAWRDIPVENDVTVTAKYPGGATGVLISCTHDPLGTDRLELDFDKGKILVEGGKKATVYRFAKSEQEWNETVAAGALERLPTEERYATEEFETEQHFAAAYIEIFENFADHIYNGTPLIATGEDGLHQVQLANAIQLSGWKGVPVKVPCDTEEFNAELQKKIDAEK